MRLGLLCHPDDPLHDKLITPLILEWKKTGIETRTFDPSRPVPACDLLFVHVDLSVLPDDYKKLITSQSIPVINGRAIDIRKTAVSLNRVTRDDGWKGPVIVKTVNNFMGKPERDKFKQTRKRKPWLGLFTRFQSGTNPLPFKKYPVYSDKQDVPPEWWQRNDLLVERFLPERDGDNYVLRKYVFLGTKNIQSITWGPDPLVSTHTQTGAKILEEAPPAEVLAARERLGLDYGKIDFGIHEGQCVVYDANKTLGAPLPHSAAVSTIAAHLAGGLGLFLKSCQERPDL